MNRKGIEREEKETKKKRRYGGEAPVTITIVSDPGLVIPGE
jgi:hypothetical protein